MSKQQHERPAADQMLTVPQAGDRLALSARKVWALIASGKLPAYRFGARATRVSARDVQRLIADARQQGD